MSIEPQIFPMCVNMNHFYVPLKFDTIKKKVDGVDSN